MGISQERMINLIDAALAMQEHLIALRSDIRTMLASDDIVAAVRHIEDAFHATEPDPAHIQCISHERAHFKRSMHKNNRDAARLRARRGAARPEDYSYTASIKPEPNRARGPRALAVRNALLRQDASDSAHSGPSDADIEAAFARAYRPEEFERAIAGASPAPADHASLSPPAPASPDEPAFADQNLTPGGDDDAENEPTLRFDHST